MKFLSIIFFISSVLSVILSVFAFLKLGAKGKQTGIALAVAAAIFGVCELICVWNSPKGLILVLSGVLLVNLIFIVSKNEEEK